MSGAGGDGERDRLRRTFDTVAARYDRMRPGYPPRVFADLAALAAVPPGGRVLEIGCGTGQATRPLAERGYRVVAVELGTELARLARRNLAGLPVEVVTAAFEDWPLPAEPFDVVLAATAFHWIDPDVRAAKTAAALRTGGALATVSTHHVAGGTEGFFADVQDCYERFDPATPPGLRLTPADAIAADTPGPDPSGLFGPPVFRRYEREITYSAAAYVELLRTYSGHIALPPDAARGLLSCVAGLIDGPYGGSITKRYMYELRVARRTG